MRCKALTVLVTLAAKMSGLDPEYGAEIARDLFVRSCDDVLERSSLNA